MRMFSRREFLKYCSLGTGALLALSSRRSSGQAPAGGKGIIDPPPGGLFKDPVEMPDASAVQGITEVSLEAKPAWVNINGTLSNVLTYNGFFPAPTIRVRRGDILKVHFKNSLPEMGVNAAGYDREVTNLRMGGLHVSPEGNSDNPLLMLPSGSIFTYEYDLKHQGAGILGLYYPFSIGSAAEQYWGGMAGALVVEDDTLVLSGYETHLLVLKDISISGSAPEPYTARSEHLNGKEGELVLVNGQVNPVLPIRPGQVQRWRIANASNARFYKLALEQHTLHVIGTDGGLLDKPYPVQALVLAPGERLDVLVPANRTMNTYRLLSMPYDRGAGEARQVTLMTLSCQGAAVHDALPGIINPLPKRSQKPEKRELIVLGMDGVKTYINNTSYSDEDAHTVESDVGAFETWEIRNQSPVDIPFHLQVNPFQVQSLTGGDRVYASFYTTTPSWKDTIIVPRQGSATIFVPLKDYAGTSLFHSQIPEQADSGMAGVWDIEEVVEDGRHRGS